MKRSAWSFEAPVTFLLLVAFFSGVSTARAQVGDFIYERDASSGQVVFIRKAPTVVRTQRYQQSAEDPRAVTTQFLENYGSVFASIDSKRDLTVLTSVKDDIGMTHVEYVQTMGGVPVLGGGGKVHLDANGNIVSAGGRVVDAVEINTVPKITSGEAELSAMAIWDNQHRPANPLVLGSTLYVYAQNLLTSVATSIPQLVWEVRLFHQESGDHERYFISAETGVLIDQLTGGAQLYREIYDCSYGDGNCYLDSYSSYFNYIYGRSEGQPPRSYTPYYQGAPFYLYLDDTDRLYIGLALAHSYLLEKFGRDGANGQGGIGNGTNVPAGKTLARSYIQLAGYTDCPNAYWDGIGQVHYCAANVTPDSVGHEYGHALTRYTANLEYKNQSGALNESMSDVFGEAIENYNSGNNDWLCGSGTLWGVPLRSMSNPTQVFNHPFYGPLLPSPDRFYSPFFYCGSSDHGGVHANSGVFNHAAYLMAMGGNFNNCTISAIGREKEERIFLRALEHYLSSTSGFNDAYQALLQSCRDLYSVDDCANVEKALLAVEANQAGPCASPSGRVDPGTACAALADSCPSDPNKLTAGQCGCGNPEIDSDADQTMDCNDQCPNNPSKTTPGVCGCNGVEQDLNQNGTLDCLDPQIQGITPPAPIVKAKKKSILISMTPFAGVTYGIKLKITPAVVPGKKRKKSKIQYYTSDAAAGIIRKLPSQALVVVSYFYLLNGTPIIESNESGKRKVRVK